MEDKEVHITLLSSELLYDIGSMCYVEGDLEEHMTGKQLHQIMDSVVGENLNRITRALHLCQTKIVELLYPFCKSESEPVELRDNELVEEYSYDFTLKVAPDFAESSVNRLSALLHDYMVSYVVADWLSITKPGAEEKWLLKCANSEQELKSTINRRMKRVRRRMSPW